MPHQQAESSEAHGAGSVEEEKQRAEAWKPRVCSAILNQNLVRVLEGEEAGEEAKSESERG